MEMTKSIILAACLFFIFSFFALAAVCQGATNKIKPGSCGQTSVTNKVNDIHRIVGGQAARNHSIPFIVSLRNLNGNFSKVKVRKGHFCGGSLIRTSADKEESDIVITAAHCLLPGLERGDLQVALGAHLESQNATGEKRVLAKKWVAHKFVELQRTGFNDIGIVKLNESVKFSPTIQPVCLPARNEIIAENVTGIVAGWGKFGFKINESKSDVLNQVVVPNLGQSCKHRNINGSLQLCGAYDREQKDSCNRDSGGPYFFEGPDGYTVQGIVSHAMINGMCGPGGVYTRVSAFIDWIWEQVEILNKEDAIHFSSDDSNAGDPGSIEPRLGEGEIDIRTSI